MVAARTLPVAGVCCSRDLRARTSARTPTRMWWVPKLAARLVKNVIALCVGIYEGRNYGDNSKASIMTRAWRRLPAWRWR